MTMARYEFFGAVFIILLGSALHFTYDASGQFGVVGVISAMNESVWEHLKLAFWPSLIWTGLLVTFGRHRIRNFWVGRASALLLPPLLIAFGFYAYTAALGHHALAIDLALFVLAVLAGQLSAMLIYCLAAMTGRIQMISGFVILTSSLAFAVLSFVPPELPLFIDQSAH